MENEYSKLFDKTFEATLKQKETKIKEFLSIQKHKSFNKTHNLILQNLEAEISEHYLKSSGLFNQILNNYNKRHKEYEEAHVNLIFNDLFDFFNLIEGIKKGFSFNNLIIELASVEATNEAYRLFRNSDRITELMYENDDLNKFSLRKVDIDNVERDEMYKKQRFIKLNRENPSRYKDYFDYLKKEKELFKTQNSYLIELFKQTEGNKCKTINFEIKEIYKEKLNKLYDELLIHPIISDNTTKKDFKNVFLKNHKEHSSKFNFVCSTQMAAYLLRELEHFFKNLNFTNIEISELFYSKEGKLIRQKNLSKSLSSFKYNTSTLNHFEANEEKNEVDNILSQIK